MTTPGQSTWVVEIDEIKLQNVASPGLQWWAVQRCAPFDAWKQRLAIVGSAIPGDIVYVRCDDREEASEFRAWALEHGCHPKAVTVRRIGHAVACKGCGKRRPYWAALGPKGRLGTPGARCRPCYDACFTVAAS